MTSVHTILHPTDFSSSADKAFQAACSLARDRDAYLIVLHVMESLRMSGEWITFELFSRPKQERWEALCRLQTREPGVRIEPMVRKGTPAAVIVAMAREVPCDLIVMGMRSHAGLGSVAAKVARLAHCPVLGVKLPAVGDSGWAKREMFPAT